MNVMIKSKQLARVAPAATHAASEMAVLYEQNLEDDLLYWKNLNKQRARLLDSTQLKVGPRQTGATSAARRSLTRPHEPTVCW